MCTPTNDMKNFDFIRKNMWMKEYLSTPRSDADPMFYQQNHVNKTLTLPFYRKTFARKPHCYRDRTQKCFPATAPISCPPMVHRTVHAMRPRAATDVALPSRRALLANYTLKLEQKVKKSDD